MAKAKQVIDPIFHAEFKHYHETQHDKYLKDLVKRNAKFIAKSNRDSGLLPLIKQK